MAYQIQNYIDGKIEIFDTVELASQRIKELEPEILNLNMSRFNLAQIIKSELGDTWTVVIDESPENGIYYVFNSETGLHEEFQSKSKALNRNQELKDNFIALVSQTPKLVIPKVQPISKGTQTL